ncbi:MAG: SurA N-terminal domain-containing protein, partial [Spirochaetota bacterium]
MKKYFIYLAAVVLAVGLICVPTGIAKIVNGIAIKVDGEIITIHELEESYRMAVNRAQLLGNETPSKKEVAARLVEKTLIQQEAERRNIFVTESELDSVIENIKEQNNLTDEQFLAELKKESLTISELKETYRIDILKTRLIGQMASSEGQSISEQEIREFYKNPANKELFIVPGTIKLSEIYIP